MAPTIVPDCTHRPPCPGCPRYGEPGVAGATLAKLEVLADRSGVALDPVVEGEAIGHRHRARLMVRGRASSPKVGLFQSGSHRIADIPHCQVQHPKINVAAAALKRAMRKVRAEPYADLPHRGLVRALQVVVERASQTAQVVVVTNGTRSDDALPLLDALRAELGDDLHSLFWNGNPERTNTILGSHWEAIAGPEAVRERIGGADVFFPPGAFGQSHLDLADRIVRDVHACVPDAANVVEFHAGCGAIGLGLLGRAATVAFNEASEASLRGLELGLAELPELAQRAALLPGRAADYARSIADADLVIVDPPRKGLDGDLLSALAQSPPPRLVYVSCDADSLVRNASALLESGAFSIERITPYALFPFTLHVETLTVFGRA